MILSMRIIATCTLALLLCPACVVGTSQQPADRGVSPDSAGRDGRSADTSVDSATPTDDIAVADRPLEHEHLLDALAPDLVDLGHGAVMSPMALPLLPPEAFARYAAALGFRPPASERHAPTALPQHLADQFGWAEMVDAVQFAYGTLSEEEKARCVVFGQNYGQAGAVDVLGRRRGLPPAVSGHNSYWLWGPGERAADVVIVIGSSREENLVWFEEVEAVSEVFHEYAMPYEQNLTVFVARRPRRPLNEIWPLLKRYV